ncbi:MAG: hypothetical protein ACT4PL_12335 [Phycisphaerales bacterium]
MPLRPLTLFALIAFAVAPATSIPALAGDYTPLPASSPAIALPGNVPLPSERSQTDPGPDRDSGPATEPAGAATEAPILRTRTLSRATDRRFSITTFNNLKRLGTRVLRVLQNATP